jgi:hypothetical protein
MTQDEKIGYLKEHIRYEVIMLRHALGKIPAAEATLDRNAFIECFAAGLAILALPTTHYLPPRGPQNFRFSASSTEFNIVRVGLNYKFGGGYGVP